MKSHVLYRFYSHTGQLLYVGITANPPARFSQHQDDKDWWSLVSGMKIETYGSREELAEAERSAIRIEHPLHNIVHNGKQKQVAADTPSVVELRFTCDMCRRPIFGETGYICVDHLAAMNRPRLIKEWEDQHYQGTGGWIALPISAWNDYPAETPWYAYHRVCDPRPESADYWYCVSRVRTERDLLACTAHLLEKKWLSHTSWGQFLYRVIGNTGA